MFQNRQLMNDSDGGRVSVPYVLDTPEDPIKCLNDARTAVDEFCQKMTLQSAKHHTQAQRTQVQVAARILDVHQRRANATAIHSLGAQSQPQGVISCCIDVAKDGRTKIGGHSSASRFLIHIQHRSRHGTVGGDGTRAPAVDRRVAT